jgi:hypothetical protein
MNHQGPGIPMRVPLIGGQGQPTKEEMQAAALAQFHQGLVVQVLPIVTKSHYEKLALRESFSGGSTPDPKEIVRETQAIAMEVLKSFGVVVEK